MKFRGDQVRDSLLVFPGDIFVIRIECSDPSSNIAKSVNITESIGIFCSLLARSLLFTGGNVGKEAKRGIKFSAVYMFYYWQVVLS